MGGYVGELRHEATDEDRSERKGPFMAAKPASAKPAPRWASYEAAGKYAGITGRTVANLVYEGKLKVYRIGPRIVRVDLNELDALFRDESA